MYVFLLKLFALELRQQPQKKSTWMGSASGASSSAPSGLSAAAASACASEAVASVAGAFELDAVKRSFLGAGGDIWSVVCSSLGGVAGAGWVSWPVVGWLPLAFDPNSWIRFGELWLLPWHSLRCALVITTLSSASRFL